MPQIIQCPSCRKRYRVGDDLAGKVVKCRCGAAMEIPRPDSHQLDELLSLVESTASPQHSGQFVPPDPDDLREEDSPAPQMLPRAPISLHEWVAKRIVFCGWTGLLLHATLGAFVMSKPAFVLAIGLQVFFTLGALLMRCVEIKKLDQIVLVTSGMVFLAYYIDVRALHVSFFHLLLAIPPGMAHLAAWKLEMNRETDWTDFIPGADDFLD